MLYWFLCRFCGMKWNVLSHLNHYGFLLSYIFTTRFCHQAYSIFYNVFSLKIYYFSTQCCMSQNSALWDSVLYESLLSVEERRAKLDKPSQNLCWISELRWTASPYPFLLVCVTAYSWLSSHLFCISFWLDCFIF